MNKDLKELSQAEKSLLFDALLDSLEEINQKSGRCIGTIQILDWINDDAVRLGIFKCPHCGNKKVRP